MTGHRFTVYDALAVRGEFAKNPANRDAKDQFGRGAYVPTVYPKMFYHPTGEETIVQRAEMISTPFGPKEVGEIKKIISKTAQNESEAQELLSAGWHDHPAKALRAGGKKAPDMMPKGGVEKLRKQKEELERMIAEAEAEAASGGGEASASASLTPRAPKGSAVIATLKDAG